MSKNLKIRVVGSIKDDYVCIVIPLWFFQIISNYQVINNDHQIFGNRNNGICLLKNKNP